VDPGCASCGGSVNKKESATESESDEEMNSEGEGKSDEEMGESETESNTDGEMESNTDGEIELDQEGEQEGPGDDYYRPVMFDPFVTVLTWKHVRYWCGQCYYERGSDKAIWRMG
jgi:hypothetical protein